MQMCGIFNDNFQSIRQCKYGVSGTARAVFYKQTRRTEKERRTRVRYCERYDTRVSIQKGWRKCKTCVSYCTQPGTFLRRIPSFSSVNRRLENHGIRPRNVASLAEPRRLSIVLRLALVHTLHDDIQSPRGWSSEVGATSDDREALSQCLEGGANSSKRARSAAPKYKKRRKHRFFRYRRNVSNINIYIYIYIHASNPALDSSNIC
jgi:hypothetical protein